MLSQNITSNLSNDLVPTESTAVGIYLLIIGKCIIFHLKQLHQHYFTVLLSFFSNLMVITVILLRPVQVNSTDVFIIALATSDMLFALCIHPMLIATSFGANVNVLFSSGGFYSQTK